jgi:hypothetical protein
MRSYTRFVAGRGRRRGYGPNVGGAFQGFGGGGGFGGFKSSKTF